MTRRRYVSSLEWSVRERAILDALGHLRAARERLKDAAADKSADAVRSALKSAEGALRHASNHTARQQRTEAADGLRPCRYGHHDCARTRAYGNEAGERTP